VGSFGWRKVAGQFNRLFCAERRLGWCGLRVLFVPMVFVSVALVGVWRILGAGVLLDSS